MRRWTNLVIVVGFVAAITVPLLMHVAGVRVGNDDVRAVEARPEFDAGSVLDRTWWERWNTYFEDHFPGRNLAVSANQRIEQEIFGTTSSRVTVGLNGWLFLTESLRAICDADLDATQAYAQLTTLADAANNAGAALVMSVIPNKETVYPELLGTTDQAGAQCGIDERAALQAAASTAADDRYLDAFDLFARARATGEPYYRTDSHWTDAGALVWIDDVIASFGLDPTTHRTVTERAGQREGDLVRLAGTTDVEDVLFLDMDREVSIAVGENGYVERSSKVLELLAESTGAPLLPGTTLVIHDSFLDPGEHLSRNQVDDATVIRMLGAFSERTVFVHWDSLGEVDLDALFAESDRVVVQVVERLVTTRASELAGRE